MKQGDWSQLPLDTVEPAWARAARAVHAEDRRLHEFIVEMHALTDALVIRMLMIARCSLNDGVLRSAIDLRNRLALEARTAPLLGRWQRVFAELGRRDEELETEIDSYLERFFDEHGLSEEQRDQFR